MKKEQIEKLMSLLFERNQHQEKIGEMQNVLSMASKDIFFNVYDKRGDKPELIACLEDVDGLLMEAVKQKTAKCKEELDIIQREIDEM